MISSYLDGELSGQDKTIFEDYMDKNIEFSNKVDTIRNMINTLKNQPILKVSDNFVDNLHSKIPELSDNYKGESTHWFNSGFKTTFGYSLLVLCISIFFINRSLISEPEVAVTDDYNDLDNKRALLSESDSLKSNDQFPIQHVKGSSNNK